jgi:hypothetical protein
MNRLILHFFAGLILLGCLHAQTPDPAEDVVSLQFRLLAWEGDIPALAFGHNQKVDLTEAATRSEIYTYTGPARLTFTLASAVSTPRKPAPVVASVLLPKDAPKVTLLTAPMGHGRYGMYVIPEDAGTMPAKSVRLHNLTSDRLLIVYNANDRMELTPGASALAVAEGKTALVIRVARMVNSQWRELFNNVVELDAAGGPNVMLIHGREGAGIGMFALPGWPKPPVSPSPP